MARRRAIEADELFETANRMKAEGKEVTAVGLLDALGGGSLRTIYKHLETWQATRPAPVITEVNEIPPQVQAAFAGAWRMAAQEAGREVVAVKEKATEEVNAALRQFHGALEAIGKLEQESEADAQEMEALKNKAAEWEATAHAAQTEAAGYKAAVEQLEKQVEKQEASLKAAEELAAKHKADSLDFRQQRDLMRLTKDKAEEAGREERAARDEAVKEAAELRGQLEAVKAQNAELMAALGGGDKKSASEES